MLASLNFVERFISLPKIEQEIAIHAKKENKIVFDVNKIAPILTRQGFEVDSIKVIGQDLDTVVVGKIENTAEHPTAQKLKICFVQVGEENLRQIVCGAANARPGLFVAVALPGSKLPGGLEIKPSKVRDVESNGMLCSREELGLPVNEQTDGQGIWELDIEIQGGTSKDILSKNIGLPVFTTLGISDVVLELSVTPNRPDMLYHEGVARELAAGFTYAGIPFTRKKSFRSVNSDINAERIQKDVIKNSSVKIDKIVFEGFNYLQAPAFFLLIDGVKFKYSPAWLRNLLESIGQNSVNSIVDASNYVLLAHGHPNHAFDLDKIDPDQAENKKLVLRHATSKEKFLGLDAKERELLEADHVVADSKNVQALLGVLGGSDSKVDETTSRIVVEFANPDPVNIRRTSRRHGRQTDASFMFEKGIDPALRFFAAAELTALLSELTEGKTHYVNSVHTKNLEAHPIIATEFHKKYIQFSSADQKKVLGLEVIPFDSQLDILSSLGFLISERTQEQALVCVPSWRANDICGAACLVEEFIRVVGIDCVPAVPFVSKNLVGTDDPHLNLIEKLSAKMTTLGYSETIGLHFMRADDHEKLKLSSINALGEPIVLLNPIIGDEPLLHTTLITDLLRKIANNLNFSVPKGQLFHSCRTFQNASATGQRMFVNNGSHLSFAENLKEKNTVTLQDYAPEHSYPYCFDTEERPAETPRLAGVCFGVKTEKTWQNTGPVEWSLHEVIAHVLELGKTAGVNLLFKRMSTHHYDECLAHPFFPALHPGRSVVFYAEDHSQRNQNIIPVGWAGELHPAVKRAYGVESVTVFAFELNVASLFKILQRAKSFQNSKISIQRFPLVSRDFSFIFQERVKASDIEKCVRNSLAGTLEKDLKSALNSVKIFDIYRDKNLGDTKKSITFNVIIEPLEKTFTEKEITLVSTKVIQHIQKELNGELRGVADL